MAWVGRDLKDHQPPTHQPQAGPPTSTFDARDQAAQGPIQLGLEHLQGSVLHPPGPPGPSLQGCSQGLLFPACIYA